MPLLHSKTAPPVAQKRPETTAQLGRERHDDYAWLKDDNWRKVMDDPSLLDKDIHAHLDAENDYTKALMSGTKDLQVEIFSEMKGRIKDDDSSVPSPDGSYAYAHRYRTGDQHGEYYRTKRADIGGSRETLLDADALALMYKKQGFSFFDIGSLAHSDDHKYLAYAVDVQGAERYDVTVLNLQTGAPIGKPIENTAGDLVWADDAAKNCLTLFWVERDDNNRPSKVWRKNILDKTAKPVMVYDEPDAGFFVSLGGSDTGDYVEISCHDHTSSEIWIIPAKTPETPPVCTEPRQHNREYDLHDHADDFYVLTNESGATDFKIMRTKQAAPGAEHWQDFIPHTPGTLIIGLETYENHLVRLERKDALPRIVIRDLTTNTETTIDFAEDAYALGLVGGYEFKTNIVRFSYSSPTTPGQIFDYNMETGERILRKTTEVPSGHNPQDYTTKRIQITARDGEEIPVTLIMRTGFKNDGKAPCLLYGYGSYGITIPASFRTNILSLIDRGFVYAIAHIRGGKAKGYDWYTKGKLATKHKTFDDFVDVGHGLAALNYTSEGRIIAHGGSAGGLLVGAALNQAPELFGGVIAAVPFVDVLNTMSDESLPLTPPEWPEWGNPLTSDTAYDTIASYCPYTNTVDANYPPVLITAGLTDPRVTYWEPAKWAAKLRDHQKGPAPIMLKTNMDAGHQGEPGRYDSLKETAFEYAFALKVAESFE
ncbi:MAG: S9 family peptidase [Robiginitomaculum sp.]|nr:S9 family peptidase [Robiginitomaculum sp.]